MDFCSSTLQYCTTNTGFFFHYLWNFVSGSHKLDRLRMKQKQTNRKIWSTILSHVLWNCRRRVILTAKLKNLYSIASWFDLKNVNTSDILVNFTSFLQFKLDVIFFKKRIWIVAPPLCNFFVKSNFQFLQIKKKDNDPTNQDLKDFETMQHGRHII